MFLVSTAQLIDLLTMFRMYRDRSEGTPIPVTGHALQLTDLRLAHSGPASVVYDVDDLSNDRRED